MGRLTYLNNILPGKYVEHYDTVYTVLNGDKQKDGEKEILDVDPGCPVFWVPFTAGNDIPDVAVKGGYLADSSTDLYVIRAVQDQTVTMFGYYDPATAKGYVALGGVREVSQMDLMILL